MHLSVNHRFIFYIHRTLTNNIQLNISFHVFFRTNLTFIKSTMSWFYFIYHKIPFIFVRNVLYAVFGITYKNKFTNCQSMGLVFTFPYDLNIKTSPLLFSIHKQPRHQYVGFDFNSELKAMYLILRIFMQVAEIIFPVCDIFVIYLYSSSFRNIRYMPNLIRKTIIMTLHKCPYSYISHAEPLVIISVTYIYNTPQEGFAKDIL